MDYISNYVKYTMVYIVHCDTNSTLFIIFAILLEINAVIS